MGQLLGNTGPQIVADCLDIAFPTGNKLLQMYGDGVVQRLGRHK